MTNKGGKDVKINVTHEATDSEKCKETAIQEHKPSTPVAVEHGDKPEGGIVEKATSADPLEEAQRLASENRDRWLRAVAELENYKKRVLQDKGKLMKYRNEELLRDLLPVIDSLHRAFAHKTETEKSSGILEGISIVSDMFREIMGRYGVTEIEALGKPFDPQFHEALGRISSPGSEHNVVLDELEKGYMYHDRLLRPAKVVVAA